MIIIAGALYSESDARDSYLSSVDHVPRLARQAPGCLDFAQAADPIDAARINVYEPWQSDADAEAFAPPKIPDDPTRTSRR